MPDLHPDHPNATATGGIPVTSTGTSVAATNTADPDTTPPTFLGGFNIHNMMPWMNSIVMQHKNSSADVGVTDTTQFNLSQFGQTAADAAALFAPTEYNIGTSAIPGQATAAHAPVAAVTLSGS